MLERGFVFLLQGKTPGFGPSRAVPDHGRCRLPQTRAKSKSKGANSGRVRLDSAPEKGEGAMVDAGNTAWLITATALVLFMTLPGLALFYGGLVRAENLLSVLMQCFAIACLVSVAWLAGAYSLAFNGGGALIGNLGKAFLLGVPRDAVAPGTSLPETVFFMFQMTFAIITPALIV